MLYLFSVYLTFCQQMLNWSFGHYITLTTLLGNRQSPTLGAHTHAHGFWAGMGAMLLFMGGHGCDIIVHGWAWVGIGFVHPCIQLQNRSQTSQMQGIR
jgi:hypothetical protein